MSHGEICRQPAPDNLQYEYSFTFQFAHIILLGIVSYSLRNAFCTVEVFVLHTVQLVASKLPVNSAVCDKAFT